MRIPGRAVSASLLSPIFLPCDDQHCTGPVPTVSVPFGDVPSRVKSCDVVLKPDKHEPGWSATGRPQ